jgi:hypothetical protein
MPIPPPSMQHMPPIPGMACGLPFRHHYPIPIPSSTHHHSAPFHPVILQHPLNRHPHNVSNNHEVYTSRNNAVNAPPPHHNNSSKLSMLPSSLMYTPALLDSANRRRSRPAPLSNKTISDFALDPYAGFMSKKEQEWLIKIHLIQCTTTGDLTEDDYYYTVCLYT